ncbi:COX15/CtaA family protein [Alicyclobacillus curvatus]|jgi:heme a synthase|nr:COX15/CtaA family protein [Alicyclobacillus curvatus]
MSGQVVNSSQVGRLSKTFWLSFVTSLWMLLVNMFGFVDTFTNSSLSLGRTWPFTQHGLFPASWDAAKFIEYAHRVLVSVLLILLIALTIVSWRKYRRYFEVKVLTMIAIVFVFAEAALGAMAVLMVSPPAVVATHMGVALIAFVAVTVLTTVIASIDRRQLLQTGDALRPHSVSTSYARWTWLGLVYVLAAIYYGSYVASTGAGGAFQGWPFPTENPALYGHYFWIDVGHRSIALGLVILLIGLTVGGRRQKNRPELYKSGIAALILTAMQAVSGALLIYSMLSIWAYVIHVCIVTTLFALVGYMAVQVLPEPQRHRAAGGQEQRRARESDKKSALA